MGSRSELFYDWNWSREAIATGEVWRLLTGHFVHVDLWHFLVNVAGGLGLWLLFRKDLSQRDLTITLVVTLLVVNVGLWYGSALNDYVGFSAVLHGVAAAGICRLIQIRDPWGWVLAVLGVGKLIFELNQGPTMLDTDYRVAIEAHWFGALGGILASLFSMFFGMPSSAKKTGTRDC